MSTLADLEKAGYVIDEWQMWQQGFCATYAAALMQVYPSLRLGILGETDEEEWVLSHFFAHDDEYAYDSAGKHPLPYHGIDGSQDVIELDQDPSWYGDPFPEVSYMPAALAHIQRNNIGPQSCSF